MTTVLLVLVLVPSLGSAAKGARRWLHVGPINIQPAELSKFVVVIYVAAYVSKKQDQLTQFARGLLPPLIVLGGAQRIDPPGARSGHGGGDGTGGRDAVVSCRGAHQTPWAPVVMRLACGCGIDLWIELSATTADDVPVSLEECLRFGLSNHPVVFGVRQRGTLRSGAGRGEAEAVLSTGGAYGFCAGLGRGGAWVGRQRGDRDVVRIVCPERLSDRRAGTRPIRPASRHGHHHAGRYASIGQCRRRHRTLADQGIDPAVRQLWRVIVSGQFVRRRHLIEYLARPAGRAESGGPRGGRKRGVVTA